MAHSDFKRGYIKMSNIDLLNNGDIDEDKLKNDFQNSKKWFMLGVALGGSPSTFTGEKSTGNNKGVEVGASYNGGIGYVREYIT